MPISEDSGGCGTDGPTSRGRRRFPLWLGLALTLVVSAGPTFSAPMPAPFEPARPTLAQATTEPSDTASDPGAESAAVFPPPAPEEVSLYDRARTWTLEGYRKEPELMLVLAGLVLLLPTVALGALVWRFAGRNRKSLERRRVPEGLADPAMSSPRDRAVPERRRTPAQLEFVDGSATPLPIRANMLRIGRHEENDICLPNKTVHRYHAVMHATPDQDYVITDLSGSKGNGVIINSSRIEQSLLRDGDVIELGEVRLRFRMLDA